MPDLLETSSELAGMDERKAAGVLDYTALASVQDERLTWRERWADVVDRVLVEWGRDPARLDDPAEGLRAPSPGALQIAIQLAGKLRDAKWPPPDRTVPNGEGGVIFERRQGRVTQTLEVFDDGRVELCTFEDCRIVARGFIE